MKTRDGWGGLARTSRDPPQEPHLWPFPVHWRRPVLLYESDMARNEIMRLRTANANRAPGPSRSRTADVARVAIPLLIAFAAPSSLVVERDRPRSSRSWATVHPARSSYSRAGSECRCPPIKSSRRTTPAAAPRSDSEECASPAWQAGVSSSCVSATCTRRTSSRQIAATRCGWSPSGSPRSSHTVNSCGPDLPAVFRTC